MLNTNTDPNAGQAIAGGQGNLTGGSTGGWLPNGQYVFPKQVPCPCCGYCPHCGRSGPTYNPNYTQPWYNPNYGYTVTCNAQAR